MKAWNRKLLAMPLGAVAIAVLPASPASAKVDVAARQTAQLAPAFPFGQLNYNLMQTRPALAPGALPKPAFASRQSYRAVAGVAPATDLWARLPNPKMSYQAGQRGPVIQFGAFGGALAHLSLDWDF